MTKGSADAARSRERWLLGVLAYAVLMTTVIQSVRPMVSYRTLELGGGPFALGMIAASFAVLSFLVAIPIGRRVDRWGEPRMLVIGTTAVVISAGALLLIDTIWALALSQAVLGVGQVMTVVANQAIVANGGDPQHRDRRFGIFTVTVSVGQLVAPAIAGVIAGGGFGAHPDGEVDTRAVFVFAACGAVAALVVALVLLWRPPPGVGARPEPAGEKRPSGFASVGEVLMIRGMPRAMVVSMSVLTSVDIITAYLPAYGEEAGLSVQTVGYLLAVRAGAAILSRIGMVHLIRRFGRRNLLLTCVISGGICLAAFPFLPLAGQFLAIAITGFGLGLGQPVTLSWVAGRAPRSLRGTALGVRLTGNRLGQVVVPAVVGALTGVAGVSTAFFALAVSLVGCAATLVGADFTDPDENP